jgi:hypothetical protein
MPKLPLLPRPRADAGIKRPEFNLLFFGDFVSLSYEEFEAAMEEVMNDPSLSYQIQTKEVYTLGMFLAKQKYRYLRLAYITFIIGAFASALVGVFSGILG